MLGLLYIFCIVAIYAALGWIITCGIIKLITICFGLTFSWAIATGIWLVMCLTQTIFNVTVNNKK